MLPPFPTEDDRAARMLQGLRRSTAVALALVTVKLSNGMSPAQEYSYLLRRSGGRWQIVYDSRLAVALPTYVVAATQQAINPRAGPNQTSPTAQAAGQRVVQRYRAAALRATPLGTQRALTRQPRSG